MPDPDRFSGRPEGTRFRKFVAASAVLGAGGLFYAREVETRRVEVASLTLTLPRLAPEFDGYRIVQIGDFHLDDWTRPERLDRIMDLVNEQRPDLVAIMGDFASYSARRLDAGLLVGALRRLAAPDGVFAILGNHDYLTDVDLVRRCVREGGITELLNDTRTLKRGGARLHVAGIDDVMEGRSRLDLVLGRLPEEGAAILLAHEPDFADVAAATGRFDLQLSGHSHGGQVRAPLLTRLVLPPFSQRYPRGLHEVGDMALYTNRGLGTVHARLRFLCRPEITVLTLSPPEPEEASRRGGESRASRGAEDPRLREDGNGPSVGRMVPDGVPRTRLAWMTFGAKRPPLVPDPGQRVELLNEDGSRLTGFRAVSGPLTKDKGGVAVRVATEQEYQDARREGRRAVSMAWDIDKVVVPPLPWWRRWFTR